MKISVLTAALAFALPASAMAANARNPYGNIDRRVDAGNDTGDSQVDVLNQQQLNSSGTPGTGQVGQPLAPLGYPLAYAYAPPPVAYYPPPPVVVAPYPYPYAWPYRYYPYPY